MQNSGVTSNYNFVYNLPMWRVVVGEGVMVGPCATPLHQPQPVTWASCGQSCVIRCDTRITRGPTQKKNAMDIYEFYYIRILLHRA